MRWKCGEPKCRLKMENNVSAQNISAYIFILFLYTFIFFHTTCNFIIFTHNTVVSFSFVHLSSQDIYFAEIVLIIFFFFSFWKLSFQHSLFCPIFSLQICLLYELPFQHDIRVNRDQHPWSLKYSWKREKSEVSGMKRREKMRVTARSIRRSGAGGMKSSGRKKARTTGERASGKYFWSGECACARARVREPLSN